MLRPFALALIASSLLSFAPAVARDATTVRGLLSNCVGCRLPHDLRGADLHDITFVGDDFKGVDLTGANLRGAKFTGDDLEGARFDNADLRDVKFIGISFRNVSFTGAKLDGMTFVGVKVSAGTESAAFERQVLRDCVGCNLESLDLHGQDLRGVRIVGSNLRETNLHGANLRDGNLVGINATSADLSSADLSGSRLVGASLRDAKLNGATIGDAVLCNRSEDNENVGQTGIYRHTSCTDLRGVDLHGIDLRAARSCDNHDSDDASGAVDCRPVTRDELITIAHADLTGALTAP
jgi:uncharacterized protein YjbI with pentapeptide repeats